MQTIWDLMPASLWPVQPFIPPLDLMRPSTWSQSGLPSWDSPPASPVGWPMAPAAAANAPPYAGTSVSPWDSAMRQAVAAQSGAPRDPGVGDMAWSDRRLDDAKRAHDFVMRTFGPPSVPQAPAMRDAALRAPPQYLGDTVQNAVATTADAPPIAVQYPSSLADVSRARAPMSGVDDASNLPPPAPAASDPWPGLGAATGNPNIARQGARARATAAARQPASPPLDQRIPLPRDWWPTVLSGVAAPSTVVADDGRGDPAAALTLRSFAPVRQQPWERLPGFVHEAEQPNPAKPVLDALRDFAHGGLHDVLKNRGVAMPQWADNLAAFLQRDDVNTAIGMTDGLPPTKAGAIIKRPSGAADLASPAPAAPQATPPWLTPSNVPLLPPPEPRLALPPPQTPQYVVRGGLSAPVDLQRNATELLEEGHPGKYGISAAMDPNGMLEPGPIAAGADITRHKQLTYSTAPELVGIGYTTIPTPLGGRPLHASILLKPGETTLSPEEAKLLSELLQQNRMLNPNYVKPPKK